MIYSNYTIGGELMHYAKGSEKSGAKYIDKVKRPLLEKYVTFMIGK